MSFLSSILRRRVLFSRLQIDADTFFSPMNLERVHASIRLMCVCVFAWCLHSSVFMSVCVWNAFSFVSCQVVMLVLCVSKASRLFVPAHSVWMHRYVFIIRLLFLSINADWYSNVLFLFLLLLHHHHHTLFRCESVIYRVVVPLWNDWLTSLQ